MKKIQDIAKEVCDNMEYEPERKIYHMKTPGDPQWIQDMIHDCHYQGMLPDDYVFEWVYQFCDEISKMKDEDDLSEMDVCSDTYSSELSKWFSSNLARADFVNDAIDEYLNGEKCDIFLMLGLAQEREMREVLWTVQEHLENQLDLENDQNVSN